MKAKTYNLEIAGDAYSGTAVEIVKAMQATAFFERDKPVEEYLDSLPESLERFTGKRIALAGRTFPERAESLLRELVRIGVATEDT
ncbi:MAG TPA: hypothetical protein VMW93_01675 [bacterium]|nr:hypothetical protein [bacterium]